jgi:hypothetical protein
MQARLGPKVTFILPAHPAERGAMLSVIIATRNCERALVHTLSMLVGASVAGVVRDVVVADAGSSDETGEIADIAGCALLVSGAPLAERLREAAGNPASLSAATRRRFYHRGPSVCPSVFFGEHDGKHAFGDAGISGIRRVMGQGLVEIDPMKRTGHESWPAEWSPR